MEPGRPAQFTEGPPAAVSPGNAGGPFFLQQIQGGAGGLAGYLFIGMTERLDQGGDPLGLFFHALIGFAG
ncbi:MAG TPA: hypothetical protein DCZ05_09245 [Deltaproteobacteria bacterium]|nr:hypothetical protein [Deltaproteobacteria bacterium]